MSDIRESLAAFGRLIRAQTPDAATDFIVMGIPYSGDIRGAGFRTQDDAEDFLLTAGCFGTCPHCGEVNGFIAISHSIWLYCATHKTKWLAAYASWIEDDREAQAQRYDELKFGDFEYVGPDAEEYERQLRECKTEGNAK